MKKNILKKFFIKLAKALDLELIDQNEFNSPTLEKKLNENLSSIKKSIVLPLGEVKLTRKVTSLLIIFRTNTNVEMWSQNRKRIFESEFEEIIDIYQKNRKKTPSQIHKSIQPKYFSLEDIKSICNHYEDLEIHKQIIKTKKKTFKMKEIKTSLIELKKNEKVFFRSQTCWTKGDPEVNHQVSDYGHIYFTNLAIIFSGYNRSSRINFTRILEIEEYEDLISLNKTSGVNDNFSLSIESIKYCMLFYKNRLKVKSKK